MSWVHHVGEARSDIAQIEVHNLYRSPIYQEQTQHAVSARGHIQPIAIKQRLPAAPTISLPQSLPVAEMPFRSTAQDAQSGRIRRVRGEDEQE